LPDEDNEHDSFHWPRLLRPARRGLLLLTCTCTSVCCSGVPELPIGRLQVALSSGVGGQRYRLQGAHFELSGDAELELSSDEDASADTLERPLPEGSYSLELEDGWQLLKIDAGGEHPVHAELVSDNPVAFVIDTGAITHLSFQFETRGGEGTNDQGSLHVGIQVDGVGAPDLVISELMKNPEALADTQGEWIELYNAGQAPLSLAGCTLSRDDQSFTFVESVVIAPAQYATLANSADPGFVPTATYRGVTLPNSGALSLRVSCGEQLLDAVTLSQAAALNRAGHSLSLAASRLDPAANDLESGWCEGAGAYNGDLGTPGRANPDCP
jgi:lamin tail-like protein